jgi:O-methyltransferase involved in polyketide biosynthesis
MQAQSDKPSFFLWEGVTMYLSREAVEKTLRTIAGTASGSVVAFDYFAADVIKGQSLYMRYATAVLNATGEPLRSGVESAPRVRDHVAAFWHLTADAFIGMILSGYKKSPT